MAGRRIRFWHIMLALGAAGGLFAGCPAPPVVNVDNPAGVSLMRIADNTYAPGATVSVTVIVDAVKGGTISAIGLSETIPEGWTFVSAAGPSIVPTEGATGTLDFAWLSPPDLPYTFDYFLLAPRDGRGSVEIAGRVEYRQAAGPFITPDVVTALDSANPAGVVLSRTHPNAFTPGSSFTIEIGLDADDAATIAAIGLREMIPEGWTFESAEGVSGAAPDVLPEAGAGDRLDFVWLTVPALPYTFQYTVMAPPEESAPVAFTGHVEYRQDGGPLSTDDLRSTVSPVNTR